MDSADGHAVHSTAPERSGRSSLVALHSRLRPLRRSRPDELCVRRIGSSGRARPATATELAVLLRTWRRLAVWWFREYACRPNALPSGPDTPALLPSFRSGALSVVFSWRGRRPTQLFLCGPDRSHGTEGQGR